MKDIKEELAERGYKIDFWYENGTLDAICVAKWEGKDLIFRKEYKVDDIAELVFTNFIRQ